jgi:hypothetical protein
MLIINDNYNLLHTLNITNESSAASDKFERKCLRYLKKKYPNHSFSLKGGDNKTTSDILVDGKFYIECKMTESTVSSKKGAQATGFGLRLSDDKKSFCLSDTAINNKSASEMIKYINKNFEEFNKLINPNTGTVNLNIDQKTFAEWINLYYKQKGSKFFIINYNGNLILFKNTVKNLLKYFDIFASARYYSNGSKNLPVKYREQVLAVLNNKYNISDVFLDNTRTYIKTNDIIENKYIKLKDVIAYLSDYKQKPGIYRLMRSTGIGCVRVLFELKAKTEQDIRDVEVFENYLNK